MGNMEAVMKKMIAKKREKKTVNKLREKKQSVIIEAALAGNKNKLQQYKASELASALIYALKDVEDLTAEKRELERQLKGKYPGGRVPKYSDERKMQIAEFYLAGGQTYDSTADKFEVSKSTVRRALTLYRSRN